jgi:glycosyltransferase involved in cell wall biosynthesis
MNPPSLGVVVPSLNAAPTIVSTLRSLEPAVAAGAQVLVVDGGSTDGTMEAARTAGVPVLHHDGGMYAALNAGFRQLPCDWLTWINADDLLYCSALWQRLAEVGDAAVTYGPVDFLDTRGRFVHCWRSARPGDLLRLYRAGYSPLLQQGTLFRRRVYEELGGFVEDFRLVADADFWWRALERGFSFRRSSHPPVAGFRLHPEQLSQRWAGDMKLEHQRMVDAHGGQRRTPGSWLALGRHRCHNLSGYIVRALRRRDLEGNTRLAASYDVVRDDMTIRGPS